jgi:hypothetical protein
MSRRRLTVETVGLVEAIDGTLVDELLLEETGAVVVTLDTVDDDAVGVPAVVLGVLVGNEGVAVVEGTVAGAAPAMTRVNLGGQSMGVQDLLTY